MSSYIDNTNYMNWTNPITGTTIRGIPPDIIHDFGQSMYSAIPAASSIDILHELLKDADTFRAYTGKTVPLLLPQALEIQENVIAMAEEREVEIQAALDAEEPPPVAIVPDVISSLAPQGTVVTGGFPWRKVFWGMFFVLPIAVFGVWVFRRSR